MSKGVGWATRPPLPKFDETPFFTQYSPYFYQNEKNQSGGRVAHPTAAYANPFATASRGERGQVYSFATSSHHAIGNCCNSSCQYTSCCASAASSASSAGNCSKSLCCSKLAKARSNCGRRSGLAASLASLSINAG